MPGKSCVYLGPELLRLCRRLGTPTKRLVACCLAIEWHGLAVLGEAYLPQECRYSAVLEVSK